MQLSFTHARRSFMYADLAHLSALRPYTALPLWVSGYDVNCQYRIHFSTRIETMLQRFGTLSCLPSYGTVLPPTLVAIGKFHLPAHKTSCRFKFAYNFLQGVGLTDGEAAERIWAVSNAWAIRAREMTWGHRHDLLNDVWNDMNVRRVHSMGV